MAGEGKFADRATHPRLMILDLKMPKADWFEVLGWLQTQSTLKLLTRDRSQFLQ